MKRGPTSTVMCRESLLWKEVGCRKDCATSVGQTKRSVVDVTKKKARSSADCTAARAGRKSETSSERNSGTGRKV